VFEIGNSLREARMRRKLELSQVERDTHIRAKYLMALEDDRFDALPGTAYAKGFLRTYADYLGLDATQFIDEFNTRIPSEDEPPPSELVWVGRGGSAWRGWVVGASLVAALVGVAAWQLASSGGHGPAPLQPPLTTTRVQQLPPHPATHPNSVRTPRFARIVITAARGPCWLAVRKRSATGPQVFDRTLRPNERARFVGRRLWIRFGAPWNAQATLNGKSVRLPSAIADVLVTSSGMSVVG
jgi:Helix-turn-helix domain/Domain of unknown function (DUF4115)